MKPTWPIHWGVPQKSVWGFCKGGWGVDVRQVGRLSDPMDYVIYACFR